MSDTAAVCEPVLRHRGKRWLRVHGGMPTAGTYLRPDACVFSSMQRVIVIATSVMAGKMVLPLAVLRSYSLPRHHHPSLSIGTSVSIASLESA